MKRVIAGLCAILSACHVAPAAKAPMNGAAKAGSAKPPIEAAMIDRSSQLTRECNSGRRTACDAAGQVASALESRGYCQPDGDGTWKKEPVCAQINNGPADLMLGNVETPVS